MKTPVKRNRVFKLTRLFESSAADKRKSGHSMVKGKNKKSGGGAAAIKQQLFVRGPLGDSTSSGDEGALAAPWIQVPAAKQARKGKEATMVAKVPPAKEAAKDNTTAAEVNMEMDGSSPVAGGSRKVVAEVGGRPVQQKRFREEESDSDSVAVDGIEDRMNKIREVLEAVGAGQVFSIVKEHIDGIVEQLLAKQEAKIKAATVDMMRREKELERCSRSLIIHNAHRLVPMDEEEQHVKYSLAEQVTEMLHTICRMMICVTEAFPMGKWKEGKPPTSICVVLGSMRQKNVVFRTIAGHMRAKTAIGTMLRGVAIRDCFPKDLIPDAQRLVQRGLELKKNGQAALFKVVARGPGVIPVLEIRRQTHSGGLGQWEVFKTSTTETGTRPKEREAAREVAAPTAAIGGQQLV